MKVTHEEVASLLGAYALDAVDADEAAAVEEHLPSCPRCRAEVSAHREIAARLGNSGGEAPDGLWARIAAELGPGGGELPPAPAGGSSLHPRARHRILRPVALSLAGVAAALAAVVGILSSKVASLDGQVRTLRTAVVSGAIAHAAAVAASDPAGRTVELAAGGGPTRAALVVLPGGQAYWITRRALRELPPDRTYQLWALASGRIVSIGLLGQAPSDVAVRVSPNMSAFMVTAEPLGGTEHPTSAVLVQGRLG